jgi:hypothetical protein
MTNRGIVQVKSTKYMRCGSYICRVHTTSRPYRANQIEFVAANGVKHRYSPFLWSPFQNEDQLGADVNISTSSHRDGGKENLQRDVNAAVCSSNICRMSKGSEAAGRTIGTASSTVADCGSERVMVPAAIATPVAAGTIKVRVGFMP